MFSIDIYDLNCNTDVLQNLGVESFKAFINSCKTNTSQTLGKAESIMSQESTQKKEKSANGPVSADEKTVNVQTPEVDSASQLEELVATKSDAESHVGNSEGNVEPVRAEQEGDQAEGVGEADKPLTLELLEANHQKELAEKDDRFMRLAAEFENYKKRTAQEMQTRIKFASQPLALNIITGLDNLERALTHAKEKEENEQLKEFVQGVEMVQQHLFEALKQNNIKRVYPKGELFDPNKHEAIGVVETNEVEPEHIAEVFQAGYFLHDRVIRPAIVQVARKK